MTTGRINQVSAYHPQHGGPWEDLRASSRRKRHLHTGVCSIRQTSTATRTMHQRVAYPFKGRGKAQSEQSARLVAQSLPEKLAPTLQISPLTVCQASADTQTRASHVLEHVATRRGLGKTLTRAEWGDEKDAAQSTDSNTGTLSLRHEQGSRMLNHGRADAPREDNHAFNLRGGASATRLWRQLFCTPRASATPRR